jgi:hypothetical protein
MFAVLGVAGLFGVQQWAHREQVKQKAAAALQSALKAGRWWLQDHAHEVRLLASCLKRNAALNMCTVHNEQTIPGLRYCLLASNNVCLGLLALSCAVQPAEQRGCPPDQTGAQLHQTAVGAPVSSMAKPSGTVPLSVSRTGQGRWL